MKKETLSKRKNSIKKEPEKSHAFSFPWSPRTRSKSAGNRQALNNISMADIMAPTDLEKLPLIHDAVTDEQTNKQTETPEVNTMSIVKHKEIF